MSSSDDRHTDIPDPTEEPLKAAYWMLHTVRCDMDGDLYDGHEEVREWASSIEWAYTAVAEHEDFCRDCLMDHDWCDGPDGERVSGEPFGGLCGECCITQSKEVLAERDRLIERLAALEHRQWIHWTKGLAEREDPPDELIKRWEQNWRPYEDLDEETKDHDRKWAEQVVEILVDEGLLDEV